MNHRTPHEPTQGRLCLRKNDQKRRKPQRGFNRLELMAVCAAVGLLALVTAPAITLNRAESQRLTCFNNLRLLGRGVQTWAGDHNQQPPWWVLSQNGGTWPGPSGAIKPGAAWAEYSWMSNELVTPKILVCPSDERARRAEDFSQFIKSGYQGLSVSYLVALHATGNAPRSWLSSDRNLSMIGTTATCSARVTGYNLVNQGPATTTGWTNGAVHGLEGHVLMMDGTVEFTSTAGFRELVTGPQAVPEGGLHVLSR